MQGPEIHSGDRVQHSRTHDLATVRSISPDGTMTVSLDRGRGVQTWSSFDARRIESIAPRPVKKAAKRKKKPAKRTVKKTKRRLAKRQ